MPVRIRGGVLKGLCGAVCALLACTLASGCDRQASEDLAQSQAPIIGGRLDTADKGVVSLLKHVQGGYYPACSGTLLTQNLVLTAHHCVAALNSPDHASVDCTKTQFQDLDQASQMLISVEANVGSDGLDPFRVAQVWVPPGDNSVCGRDIALLLLSGGGVPAAAAKPIEPSVTREFAANEVFAAIGFGLQDPKDQSGQTAGHRMSVGTAKVFCRGTACGTDMIKDGEFIADSPVCSGDSGGPALDKTGRVGGVTSRGDEKCTVGIYSSVFAWKDFIIEKTFEAAMSGHYNPPTWAGTPPTGFDPGVMPTAGSSGVGVGGGGSGGSGNPIGSAGSTSSSGTGPLTVVGGGPGSGGAGSTVSPTIDPLGLTCTGQCPGSYKCWAETGEPPGICVPECSSADDVCPSGYACNTQLGACTKAGAKTSVTESGSCSVQAATGTPARGGLAWLALALFGLACRARRQASAAAKRQANGT